MKRIFLCILGFVLALSTSNGALAQDYVKVDQVVGRYPGNFSDTAGLAEKIRRDFTRDDERARAAYTWIANNIAYDVKSYFSQKAEARIAFYYSTEQEKQAREKIYLQGIAQKALQSKIAVCQGYAILFRDLCQRNGITCEIVPGTAKSDPVGIGKLPRDTDHAWNAVKIGAEWKLVDVTWGAGAIDNSNKFVFRFNDGYFFSDPDLFFLNHFPQDKKWLFTGKTAQEFAALPLYFREYMVSDYTFLEPENGIIAHPESEIPFRIMDLPETDCVSYAFSGENQSRAATIRRRDNIAEFEIPVTEKAKGYLTIFINNHSVAAYKLQR